MALAELIGPIRRLQVQAEPLKASGVYDPEHLIPVDRAVLSAAGMLGWDGRGWVVDAHHDGHPRARGGGRRALSIGFTGHYSAMDRRFGSAPLGIAGENIVVDGPALRLAHLEAGLLIRRRDGTEIELHSPRVAAPCREFTSFLLGFDGPRPRNEIADELEFLSEGTRGFILAVDHLSRPVEIQPGDEIYHAGS